MTLLKFSITEGLILWFSAPFHTHTHITFDEWRESSPIKSQIRMQIWTAPVSIFSYLLSAGIVCSAIYSYLDEIGRRPPLSSVFLLTFPTTQTSNTRDYIYLNPKIRSNQNGTKLRNIMKQWCRAIGSVSWFPVHCTSINNTNTFISGDNKGVAAQYLEKWARKSGHDVVSAFAQANVGDTSPNTGGAYCQDTGISQFLTFPLSLISLLPLVILICVWSQLW